VVNCWEALGVQHSQIWPLILNMISMDHASKPDRTVTYVILPNTPQWGVATGTTCGSPEYHTKVAEAQESVVTEARMPAHQLEVLQCFFLYEEHSMYSPDRDLGVNFLLLGSKEATQQAKKHIQLFMQRLGHIITLVLSSCMYCCPVINSLVRLMLVDSFAMSFGVLSVGTGRLFQD
jgi:hypothetical protein